jgi:hypothetical protein
MRQDPVLADIQVLRPRRIGGGCAGVAVSAPVGRVIVRPAGLGPPSADPATQQSGQPVLPLGVVAVALGADALRRDEVFLADQRRVGRAAIAVRTRIRVRAISRLDWTPSASIVSSCLSPWKSTGPPASGSHSWTLQCWNSGAIRAYWLPWNARSYSPITIASNPRSGSAIAASSAAACGRRAHGSTGSARHRRTPR